MGFINLKDMSKTGFEEYKAQIRKDVNRVNWPWNSILNKYQTKASSSSEEPKILIEPKNKQSPEDYSFESLTSEIEEEEFSFYGECLDNFDHLSKAQLINLKNVHKMLSKATIRILETYAFQDPQVGYVQGMHSIAVSVVYNFFLSMLEYYKLCKKVGPLLCNTEEFPVLTPYFERKKDLWMAFQKLEMRMSYSEAEMFETFTGLMQNLNLKMCYGNDFTFMKCKIDNFSLLLKEKLYSVYLKLTNPELSLEDILEKNSKKLKQSANKTLGDKEEEVIPLITYFASFYLTIFLNLTPVEISHTLISTFSLVGYDLVDHILLGLLVIHQKEILELDGLGEVMKFVTKKMVNISFKCDVSKSYKDREFENYRIGIGGILLVGSIEQLSDDTVTDNRLATLKFWESKI